MVVKATNTITLVRVDDGATGISVAGYETSYAISTSGTTIPTSGWSSTQSAPSAGQYQWTRTRFKYSDGTYTAYAYSVVQSGKDSIIISTTAPSNPVANSTLWQNPSDTTGTVKIWNGSAWVAWGMSINNLLVSNVSIENGVFKSLTGVDISASKFINTFTKVPLMNNSGSYATGTSTLVNGNLNSTGFVDNTFPIQTQYSPVGLDQTVFNADGSVRTNQSLYMGVLSLTDASGNYGSLEAKNLASVPWTNIPLATGAIVSESNTPQYRKIANLDGSYTIELRGQVGFSAGKAQSATLGTLPTGNRPSANHMYQQPCNHYYGARIAVLTGGGIQFRANWDTEYVALTGIRFTI